MQTLRSMLVAVGRRNCTVLINGESGVGKELIARHLHASSPRAHAPFVPVDCTALKDTLFESQLFGHTKGAFTGAEYDSIGFFRAADGGTLFLDEVGELQFAIQAKLLRCIQEASVVPLGTVEPIPVDVRIIAATNRNLRDMVNEGTFRADLYYRLNVVQLEAPPLRERRDDILPLARFFLERQALLYGETSKRLAPEVERVLLGYDWPGNVRQLANAMERSFVLSGEQDTIERSVLPPDLHLGGAQSSRLPRLADVKRDLILRALRETRGRKMAAAELLGIERRRLNRLLTTLRIEYPAH